MTDEYKLIALCISKLHNKLNQDLTRSLNERLTALGYRLLVFHTTTDLYRGTENDAAEREVFRLIPYDSVEAVVIYNESIFDKGAIRNVIAGAHRHHVPVINIGSGEKGCYNIIYEYEKGFATAIRHLIEFHHKKDICMIGGFMGNAFSDEREAIFRSVMEEYGLPCEDDRIYYGNLWERPTIEAARAILGREHLPEAVVCVNDYTAITASDVFRQAGVRIPEELLITGFDGTMEAEYSFPSITTCRFDTGRVADLICGYLLNASSEAAVDDTVTHMPFTLIYGASCGCGSNKTLSDIGGRIRQSEDSLNGYIDFEGHLYEFSEKLILSASPAEQKQCLEQLRIQNCSIMLNKGTMDPSVNPMEAQRENPFGRSLPVVYANGISKEAERHHVTLKELTPGLDEILQRGVPVIFNVLSYLGNTMGYMCFYDQPSHGNYCHIIEYITMLNQAIGGARNVQYLRRVANDMEALSERDFLTGLLNRKGFFHKLPAFTRRHAQEQLFVASIDLDGLKYINDHFGHSEGDRAIGLMARAINGLPARSFLAGRFGGDEFVLLVALRDEASPEALLSQLERSLKALGHEEPVPYELSCSCGYVLCEHAGFDFEALLKESDEAMYRIKKTKPHHRVSS